MRTLYKYFIVLATAFTLTSCMEDVKPQGSGATAEQVMASDKIGLVNGLTQYLNTAYAGYSSGVYTGIGYPEHLNWHNVMTADMPIRPDGYNYWDSYSECLYMGDWAYQSYYFWYYNKIIYMATSVIKVCDKENAADALNLATGYAFRAFFNLDMTRMYEYKHTGASNDAEYYSKLKGLTIPIVNEYTTEEMAVNNPRVPFYEMYRYILNDLNLAKAAIERSYDIAVDKNYASAGMVYGNLARFWLEVATRFERYPEDLAEQISHDKDQWPELGESYQALPPIGVTSANEAFAKAAEYARKVINMSYTPLAETQWYDRSTGFNTVNNSWIWAIIMSTSDNFVTNETWMSWVSFMSPEAQWGISGAYQGQFMIDADLFSKIPDSDWRKLTWIDPADLPVIDDWSVVSASEEEPIKNKFYEKYSSKTNLSYDQWKLCRPYVGFKFHPGSGNITSSTTGNRADIPLMRVEEMYFIEAEALAHTQGLGAGIAALSSFLNTYRYSDGSYTCTASSMRDFEEELVKQKRIEFWGEGITLFDIKRLELPIIRGYENSNHDSACQFNSLDGYVAPWTILYIPSSEADQNPALLLNPDPSSVTQEFKYVK